jgi:protein-S-isoprenylcysteine O-methyltransferase Ste14
MTNSTPDSPGVIAPPPLIYAGGLVIGLLLQNKFPLPFLPKGWRRAVCGSTLMGLAVIIVRQGVREMQRAQTNVNPRLPATKLVIDGPFGFSRNPLYLSMAIFYTGVAVLANALWPILLLPIVQFVMRAGVVEREERYLERKFGDQYLSYKAKVRRWL